MAEGNWSCTVCGYVHVGDMLPAFCPVCGADRSLFDSKGVAPAPVGQEAPQFWRCLTCYYLHAGGTPPAVCPVCGCAGDRFEPAKVDKQAKGTPSPRTIVVIGAGISGISAAEAARKAAPSARIVVISRERDLPYYRLNLTRCLAGELADGQLLIHPAAWYRDQRIDLQLDCEVLAIDAAEKTLRIKGQRPLAYDKLILSMGAHPFIPPVEGVNRSHVQGLRTRHDVQAINAIVRPGMRCVVIGGGVLGLETAAALVCRGAEVTVVEGFDWLLPRQLNRTAGELLRDHVERLGIRLICGGRVHKLTGDEQVRGVILESGEELPASLVIFAAGVRCNSFLGRQAHLEVHNGILVDNTLRTSHPDIFAVGDVAEHQGVVYGTWLPAQAQGAIAGINATGGGDIRFSGVPRSNSLKVLEVDLFSIGQITPEDGSYSSFEEREAGRYALFMFRNNQMVGAILLGDTALSRRVKELIEKQTSCSELIAGADDGGIVRRRLQEGL